MTTTRAAIVALLVSCALALTAASTPDACCVIGEPATYVRGTSTPMGWTREWLPMVARDWQGAQTVMALGEVGR